MLADWEKNLKLEFQPKPMKDFISKVLEECNSWEVKKQTELTTVRMKYGWHFHDKLAVHSHYHIFPNCKDPQLILDCLKDLSIRKEWDDNLDQSEELTQYQNQNTSIQRLLNKSVINTAQREFIDKKFWFRDSQTGDNVDPEFDDLYVWTTAAPDSCYQMNKKYVRAWGISIGRIGRRRDGKPGCFLEQICQNDAQINKWIMSTVLPLMTSGMVSWGNQLRDIVNKKQNQASK